jgi:hypothetical protein
MTILHELRDALDEALGAPVLDEEPTMLGRWAPWYKAEPRFAHSYGPEDSYLMAAGWLRGLAVEDWGCGYAHFESLHHGPYVGIDGSGEWADKVVDLARYVADPPAEGVLVRHVLEHNPGWRKILASAVASFSKRMVLVVFTPDCGQPGRQAVLAHVDAVNVDDLALPHQEIETFFAGCAVLRKHHLPTATGYQGETVWLVER